MLIYAPINQLRDNPFQKRTEYGDIEELANDIYSHKLTRPDTLGLQQIPNGRLVGDDDGLLIPSANLDTEDWLDGDRLRPGWTVQLEFGHRRSRAFQHLVQNGRAEYHVMPVIIRDLSDEQMLDGVHSENAKRKDISAVEEAELVAEKIAITGRSQKDIAGEWGLGRSTVTNLLALLKLPEEVQEANRRGILSARQCSSLATIARIGELADDVEWGDGLHYYRTPPSPADFIQHVIDNPEVTSDTIRDYTKKMLDHAGVTLPDAVARHDYNGAPEEVEAHLVQHQCRGCSWRINQHCLNGRCVETKTGHLIDLTLAEASDNLRIPVSDDTRHLDLSYSQREALEAYWISPKSSGDTDLVIGWQDSSGAVRPFSDDDWIRSDDIWGKDGDLRNGVILGYKDPKRIPATSKGEDAPDIADEKTRDGWVKQADKVRKANVANAKANLREVIETAVADFRPLVALIQPLDAETTDETSVLVESLVEFLWKRGSVPWSSSAADEAAKLNQLLHRAGAEPLPALSFQERAAVALAEWYRVHRYAGEYWLEDKEAAAAAIAELRQEIVSQTFTDADMLQLSVELDRAAADARRVLGEEEQAEAAENDYVACADCGDLLESDTEERCSCGTAVCEDCYVERGHVDHDESRDALYDDLVEAEETAVKKSVPFYINKPPTYANVYGAVQCWMMDQRINDIPGQLELMLAIEEHGEGHELWSSMLAELPAGWHDGDLYTAISEKIAYLEELVAEKTAVEEAS